MPTKLELVGIEKSHTLRQLLELYSYDFTKIVDADVNEEGRFNYPLEQLGYFSNPEREAYFIRHEGQLAGFVLLRNENNKIFHINEFFVLNKYRKSGVGQTIAYELFNNHQGEWVINITETNRPAISFWEKILSEYKKGQFDKTQDKNRIILKFKN